MNCTIRLTFVIIIFLTLSSCYFRASVESISPDSTSTEVNTDTTPPTNITFITPSSNTDITATNYNFSWNASTDTGSGLHTTQSYLVETFANGTCTGTAASSIQQTGTSHNFTSLVNGESYSVRVTAKDNALNTSSAVCSSSVTMNTPKSFNSSVNSILNLSDGKLLVAGDFSAYAPSRAPRIISLNSDGTVDTSMSAITTGFNRAPRAIIPELDTSGNATGKMIVVGDFSSYNGVAAYSLVRINSDGSLDTGFAAPVGTPMSAVRAIIQELSSITGLPTGKFLISGEFTDVHGTSSPDGVTRLNSDGSVDTSFNSGGSGTGGGKLVVLERNSTDGLPTGKIILLGQFSTYNGANVPDRLIRLNSDGTYDNTFNNGGAGMDTCASDPVIHIEYGSGGLPTGKILVSAGISTYNGTSIGSRAAVRVNSDGTYDSSFDTGSLGIDPVAIIVPEYNTSGVTTGKHFMGGAHWGGTPLLFRLNSDGSVDASFNSAGTGFLNVPWSLLIDGTTYASGARPVGGIRVVLQERDATGAYTGKIYIGGRFISYNGVRGSRNFLRLNADGSIDNTYAANTAAGFGSGLNHANYSMTNALPNGKILIVGEFMGYGGTSVPFGIARLNSGGGLDASFSAGGVGFDGEISEVITERDTSGNLTGKYLVVGLFTSYNGTNVGQLARLNSDGSLDTSFNSGGSGFSMATFVKAIKQELNTSGAYTGKILVGYRGSQYNGAAVPGGILRLNADGTHDNTFNNGGAGLSNYGANDFIQELSSSTGLPTGNIVIVGTFSSYNGNASAPDALLRITSSGSYDSTFNDGNAGFSSGRYRVIHELDMVTGLPTGKFIVAGGSNTTFNGSSSNNGALTRITSSGALDATFSNSSGLFTEGGGPDTRVNFIINERDTSGNLTGKLLVGGRFDGYDGVVESRKLIRVNSNGTRDASFNSGGFGWSGHVMTLAQELSSSTGLPTGNILVGGWFNGYNSSNVQSGISRITSTGAPDNKFYGY